VTSAGSRAFILVLGLLFAVATSGCAGVINAESGSSLVRERPTTAPETFAMQMDGTVRALRNALDELAALLAEPHYLDDTWKSDVVNLATLVELGYRQLESLTPPENSRANHAAAVQAVQDCQTLAAFVFEGINNLDKGPFDEVAERVGFCQSKLEVATRAPGSVEAESQPANFEAARKAVQATIKRDANLRGGPSTKYERVATAAPGDLFTVTGRTEKGDWLQVTNEKVKTAWIAAFLVQTDGDLNTVPVAK
jgi:hypothetical protein